MSDFEIVTECQLELPSLSMPFNKRSPPLTSLSNKLVIQWSLSYTLPSKSNYFNFCQSSAAKQILQHQSGHVCGGELLGLMGPSGAGKSTLLNCLTGRLSNGLDGDVTVSLPSDRCDQSVTMSFLTQHNSLFRQFTVYETLQFASQLKNGPSFDHHQQITKTLDDLAMTSSVDSKVGQLSGGQHKRLAICCELISRPDILILDEPTTGLDSTAAAQLMSLLSELAVKYSTAVICSIHQPSREIFDSFSRLYLMSTEGSLIYDAPPNLIHIFFDDLGLVCPKNKAYADFAIDVARGKHGKFDQLMLLVNENNNTIETTDLDEITVQVEVVQSIDSIDSIDKNINNNNILVSKKLGDCTRNTYKNSFWYESWLLWRRSFLLWNIRTPLFVSLFMSHMLICTITMMVFPEPPGREPGCVRDDFFEMPESVSDFREHFIKLLMKLFNGAMSVQACLIYLMLITVIPVSTLFPYEYNVIKSERGNQWYRTSSYHFGRVVAQLMPQMALCLVMVGVAFWLGEMPKHWDRFLICYLLMLLCTTIADTISLSVSAIFVDNIFNAIVTCVGICVPMVLMSGFFISAHTLSPILRPLADISFARYTFDGFMIAMYGLGRCQSAATIKGDLFSLMSDMASPLGIMRSLAAEQMDSANQTEFNRELLTVENVAKVLNLDSEMLTNLTNRVTTFLEDDLVAFRNKTMTVGKVDEQLESNSYLMSHYRLEDDLLTKCFAMLCLLLFIYQVILFFVFKRTTRRRID